jgi:hypothetical protein
MDIKYIDKPINLSTIQWDEDTYLNNYKNQKVEKLSRYIFNHSYYPKVSNNIYNTIFNYYRNMNYPKKETEFIKSLNDFKFNYDEYMKHNGYHIQFFVFTITTLVYTYFIYKFLSFVMFFVFKVFSMMYNFLTYNNNDNNNDINDNNVDVNGYSVNNNSNISIYETEIETTDESNYESTYIDPLSELYNYESEYLPDSDDENEIQEDEVLEYYETEEETDIEKSELVISNKINKITDIDEFEIYDIQTILLDVVFKDVSMKKISSKCNKQSIRTIRKFHNCKSLNKTQLIMAFMHTYIYRYYNNEKHIVVYKSFFNYLHSKLQKYRFNNCAKLMQENITSEDIDKYINYYFDIQIIIDC